MVSVVMGTTFGDPISDDHFGSQDDIPQIDTSWCWIGDDDYDEYVHRRNVI
jgi:hypothetical protein